MVNTQSVVRPGNEKARRLMTEIARNKFIYMILLPGVLFYVLFHYFPMYGITLAFKEFWVNKGITGSPWIGFRNFENLFLHPGFWNAMKNTLIISLGKLVFTFPVPIILSILINEMRDGRYKKFIQTVFTFPHFLSWIIVAGILNDLLGATGAINNLLNIFGLARVDFLASSALFKPLLFCAQIWKEAGWSCIMYMAAISSINPELYEAAKVDGANRFVQMRHVTWPGMKSTVVVLFILAVGGMMNAGFEQVFNLYNSVVMDSADIIDTFIYRMSFQSATDFGFSTAAGLFKSVINFALLISADRVSKLAGESGIF